MSTEIELIKNDDELKIIERTIDVYDYKLTREETTVMSEIAKYVYVDDIAHVERIKKGIEKKIEKFGAGYCPCVAPAAHCEDTICPCKEYRETGHCHCRMYKE